MPFSITKFRVIKCEEGLINSCLSIIDHQKESALLGGALIFYFGQQILVTVSCLNDVGKHKNTGQILLEKVKCLHH
jgi:hypothetical protein